MRVNSPTKVANLNADLVDGKDAAQLGGASAYAVVNTQNPSPDFDSGRTSGFASVTRVDTGSYCLEPASGVTVRGRAIAVSVDWPGTQSPEGNASAMFGGDCGAAGISIRTQRQSIVQPFNSEAILISPNADDVSFHVVVL